jgi:hypothetical protein
MDMDQDDSGCDSLSEDVLELDSEDEYLIELARQNEEKAVAKSQGQIETNAALRLY